VVLFGCHGHMIIKMRKVDSRAEGGTRILIKESDRDKSSLEKSSTDTIFKICSLKKVKLCSVELFIPSLLLFTNCLQICCQVLALSEGD
jgi:hypothetical protein